MHGGVGAKLSGDVIPFEVGGMYACLLCVIGAFEPLAIDETYCATVDTCDGGSGCTDGDARCHPTVYVISNSYL